jgi:hypothetical protein
MVTSAVTVAARYPLYAARPLPGAVTVVLGQNAIQRPGERGERLPRGDAAEFHAAAARVSLKDRPD